MLKSAETTQQITLDDTLDENSENAVKNKAIAEAIVQNTSDISDLQGDEQDKTLEAPLTIGGTSQTTVEGALGGLNGLVLSGASMGNKSVTDSAISNYRTYKSYNISINSQTSQQIRAVATIRTTETLKGRANIIVDYVTRDGNISAGVGRCYCKGGIGKNGTDQ